MIHHRGITDRRINQRTNTVGQLILFVSALEFSWVLEVVTVCLPKKSNCGNRRCHSLALMISHQEKYCPRKGNKEIFSKERKQRRKTLKETRLDTWTPKSRAEVGGGGKGEGVLNMKINQFLEQV